MYLWLDDTYIVWVCDDVLTMCCHVYLCEQAFHLGPNYLEVDLDVHNYAFLARKALWSYHDRVATVVWDMGFVIQVGGSGSTCVE